MDRYSYTSDTLIQLLVWLIQDGENLHQIDTAILSSFLTLESLETMSFNVLKTDFFLHKLLEAYFECKILSPLRKRGKRLPSAGRSGGDKSGKGLRHFSMKVCEKVQQKRTTSYNEVITLTHFTKQGADVCQNGV